METKAKTNDGTRAGHGTVLARLLAVMLLMLSVQGWAAYINVSQFTVTGAHAGAFDAGITWDTNYWNEGTGGYWGTSNAIMKYDTVSVPSLTLTTPWANGTYEILVTDVFNYYGSAATTFPFTVEGVSASALAPAGNPWLGNYSLGVFTITDGALDIVVGSPSGSSGGSWQGFSGFIVPEPAAVMLLALGSLLGLGRTGRKAR